MKDLFEDVEPNARYTFQRIVVVEGGIKAEFTKSAVGFKAFLPNFDKSELLKDEAECFKLSNAFDARGKTGRYEANEDNVRAFRLGGQAIQDYKDKLKIKHDCDSWGNPITPEA